MPHIRNLLQPSPEVRNLLKKIRTSTSAETDKEANLNNFYIAGCVSSTDVKNITPITKIELLYPHYSYGTKQIVI